MPSPLPTFFRPATFKFQIIITAPNETFTLPINEGGAGYVQNFNVNWGDNSSSQITSYDDADRIHTYVSAGTYDIELNGTCEWFAFNNAGDKTKIYKLLSFTGDIGFKVLNFRGCINLNTICSLGIKKSLTTAQYMFMSCSSLTTIPAGMFDGCTEITSFNFTFYQDGSILSIPIDLFKYNTKVTDFSGTFSCCILVTSIPTDLFKYNILATTFNATFSDDAGLLSLPLNLFRYNILVTDFSQTFDSCTGLTSLPSDLFQYNTLVTTFYSTFGHCIHLTAIPSGLFDNNTLVTSFINTFLLCADLTGDAPELWLRDPEPTGTTCFYTCTELDNYADIPAEWK